MHRSSLVAAALLSVGVVLSTATSCGEPRQRATDTCSDQQCSRILTLPESAVGVDGGVLQNGTNYFGFGMCVRGLPAGSPCSTDDDCYVFELSCTNNTCTTKADTQNTAVGYGGVVIAVLGFGSYFIPVKKARRTGNGVVFQQIQATSIMVVGIITAIVIKRYTFYPMSMVGGMFWAFGNVLSIPAVQLIGMGLGMSTWGITNMVLGWASGKFGLMGVKAEAVPKYNWLSYFGICVALVSIVAFAMVKPTPTKKQDEEGEEEGDGSSDASSAGAAAGHPSSMKRVIGDDRQQAPRPPQAPASSSAGNDASQTEPLLLSKYSSDLGSAVSSTKSLSKGRAESKKPLADNIVVNTGIQDGDDSENAAATARAQLIRRALGFFLALASGVVYGINFNPSQAMMDYSSEKTLDDPSSTPSVHFSPNGLDYVFSSFIGIFFTSVWVSGGFYAVHMYLPEAVVRKYIPTLFHDSFAPPARVPVDPETGLRRLYFSDFEDMICPALASGAIWAVAQIGWFIANTNLGLTMSFPLVCLGPSIVANVWGVLLFREIQGRRNFMFLGSGFVLVGISCFCTVFSKG